MTAQNRSLLPRVSSQVACVILLLLYMPFAESLTTLPMRLMLLRNLSMLCKNDLLRFMQDIRGMFLRIGHFPKWSGHLIFQKNYPLP